MTTFNTKNLQKLHAALVANRGYLENHLEMGFYCTEDGHDLNTLSDIQQAPECGTTFCCLGMAAHLNIGDVNKYLFNGRVKFGQYCSEFINTGSIVYQTLEWDWLFGDEWPNDYDQMLARIQYAIDNDCVHPKFYEVSWGDYYLKL